LRTCRFLRGWWDGRPPTKVAWWRGYFTGPPVAPGLLARPRPSQG
jgi:hypothetical protein